MRAGRSFIEDVVVRVDPSRKELHLQQGEPVAYDVVSFNTGSGVSIDDRIAGHEAVVPVKPIEKLLDARNRIIAALKQKRLSMVVAGGGPAGLEIAANLRRLVADAAGCGGDRAGRRGAAPGRVRPGGAGQGAGAVYPVWESR